MRHSVFSGNLSICYPLPPNVRDVNGSFSHHYLLLFKIVAQAMMNEWLSGKSSFINNNKVFDEVLKILNNFYSSA